jgi:hypothetical protein
MGTSAFYNYTSWSKPYKFTSGNKLGYTVSALVYNRDVQPPRFMGAVGMDISAEAAKNLYGGTMEETEEAMNEIIRSITEKEFSATCEQQRIKLTYCEIQSVRQLAGGDEAVCFPSNLNVTNQNATGILFDDELGPGVIAKSGAINDLHLLNCSKAFIPQCPGYDEYPNEVWYNINNQNKSFAERVCCEVGTNIVTDKCPELEESDIAISNAASESSKSVPHFVIGCYICQFLKSFPPSLLQLLVLFSPHWLLWNCLAATFASTIRKRGMFRSRCDFDLTQNSGLLFLTRRSLSDNLTTSRFTSQSSMSTLPSLSGFLVDIVVHG